MNKLIKKGTLVVLMSTMLSLSGSPKVEAYYPKEEVTNEVTEDTDEVTLLAVGDDLIHTPVYKSGLQSDGTYNYDSFFANIKDELDTTDIKVINQETVLVKDASSYSGYPCFGSPYAIGDAIKKAGFNVVLQATNHAYDKGETGIMDSLDYWNNTGIKVLGIHKDATDADKICVIEKNGIKIAMLNYTYGLNGFKVPDGKDYLVDTLYDKNKVVSDIKKAKQVSDVVIVFPHWGTEYVYDPTSYQTDYAQTMADAGADIIIGGHPHVVEPLEYIKSSDGRTVPVYYSLGNFISAQDEKPRMLGGMAYVTIDKTDDEVNIKTELLPVVTHNEGYRKPYTAYMLKDYTDSLAQSHRMHLSLDYLTDLWNSIVEDKDKVKER